MTVEELHVKLYETNETELRIRAEAFLLEDEILCGFRIRPLSMRHVSLLELAGCPFIVGGIPTVLDVARFLWVLSFEFAPDKKKFEKFCKKIVSRKISDEDMAAVSDYVTDSFQDSPGSSGSAKSYYHQSASMVHMFGSTYGWTAEYTMNLPLKCAFQLLRAIRSDSAEKSPIFFSRCDPIRAEINRLENGN